MLAVVSYAQQSVRGAITETTFEKAFDANGQAITKRDLYSPDAKIEAPIEINFLRKAVGKSLSLDFEIIMRTTGEFQRYDEFLREVRYTHKYRDSVLTGDTERYDVGSWRGTGVSEWRKTGFNVKRYPIDINLCLFSC